MCIISQTGHTNHPLSRAVVSLAHFNDNNKNSISTPTAPAMQVLVSADVPALAELT